MIDELAALSRQVRDDLETLRYPFQPWVVPHPPVRGTPVLDVVIIGGGQSGLAIAAALKRDRVENIAVLDRAPAGSEGPWTRFARMPTLRTAKVVPGLELGLPNATPRAWYTARYGHEAWDRLERMSRQDWQSYLTWCREAFDIPVENLVEVTGILPEGELLRIESRSLDPDGAPAASRPDVLAREVVLATGLDGNGAWHAPDFISRSLPGDRYALAAESIDFAALAGKRVAVLGAGASAFDNASTALEAGAREARLCIRRPKLQRVNPQLWMGKAGVLRHFADLDDAWKWRFMRYLHGMNIPAPQSAYDRLARLPGAHILENAGWTSVGLVEGPDGPEVEIATTGGRTIRTDFLIVSIGFVMDLARRPELSALAPGIALWRDRFHPPAGEDDPIVASYPYLGPGFAFSEKVPGTAPHLRHIRNFTYGAMASMGLSGAALSGLRHAVPRLVEDVTRSLFVDDVGSHFDALIHYSEPELTGPIPIPNTVDGCNTVPDRSPAQAAE